MAQTLGVAQPNGGQSTQAHWTSRLAEIGREDARAGTLGPVGRRLWATRLLPLPGFVGEAHYLQHTAALRDPLSVEFLTLDGQPVELALRGQSWAPTHSRVEYTVPIAAGGRIVETRLITAADVFVSRFEVFGLPALRLRWRAPLAPNPTAAARFMPLPIGPADVVLATAASLRVGDPLAPIWLEGESATASGTGSSERRAAASAGAVLGGGFGGARGQRATWSFVGSGVGTWTACLRYARPGTTAARWSLLVDGVEKGEVQCAPTGGLGDEPSQFAWAKVDVGDLASGVHELALAAADEAAEVNLDGLLLLPSPHESGDLPPMPSWRHFDALRGAVLVDAAISIDGVPFELAETGRGRACEQATEIALPGTSGFVHVLCIPTQGEARVATDGGAGHSLGLRQRDWRRHVAVLPVGPSAKVLRVSGGVLLSATLEATTETTLDQRDGDTVLHGVPTHVVAAVHGLQQGRLVPASTLDQPARLHAMLALSSPRAVAEAANAATAAAVAVAAQPERPLVLWLAAHAPRLTCDNPLLQRLWTYRWFLVHHNTAWPEAGNLPVGPVVYEGRHGSWYPRVITFSTPHIVAETRWLGDPALTFGNVRAHLRHAAPGEDLPNVLVDGRGFRYTNWIGEAVVEACKVHGDRRVLEELVPALARNVKDLVARFDPDHDGLLAPGDHYTTGMEFQPSFWFHAGYDNSKPQTELERPDFNAYVFGSAMSLSEGASLLGMTALADELQALAQRIQAAVLASLWHAEDGFFYSVREGDDDPARCAEVIGFYPFRFGLAGAQAPYARALRKLGDRAEFYGPFPPTSCSRRVPVFAAAVQQWPGPGGVVTPCMWNGPFWPHATSLAIDAVARVVRAAPANQPRLCMARADDGAELSDARALGEMIVRFARFHCEDGDPSRPLLREYGDADRGRSFGCADYMHSTFNDLLIRHWAGLVPRFDNALEVRPLDVGLGDVRIDDITYHGRKVSIVIAGEDLEVFVDGKSVAKGSARSGVLVHDAL